MKLTSDTKVKRVHGTPIRKRANRTLIALLLSTRDAFLKGL